jgi:dipicolinate synthase subunit B
MVVGFAFCGSFCTIGKCVDALEKLKETGVDIIPVMSETVFNTDNRFNKASELIEKVESICGNKVLHTITMTEPIGPKKLLDALIIAPCTGNTMAKLACGITDTSVTLAAKAHLRNGRPPIIAPSTNDALSNAAKNIGALLNYKNLYFVPFGEDNFVGKPTSMVADFAQIQATLEMALKGKQIQPIIIEPK